ncbi:hypothetical protein Tco_0522735 [Tanacetum coccineum]
MERDKVTKNPPLDQTGGTKIRRARKEPESTSAPQEKTSKTTGKSTEGSKSHHKARSSNESKTSYAVAANLSELELKKILIDKIEKLILDTYGDTVSFKRCQDDGDKDKEPSARLNWGSKRRRAGKEPKSTSAPKEKTSKTTDAHGPV